MSRYNKTLVALVPVLLATLEVLRNALSTDDSISTQEALSVVIAALTAIGVYLIPNKAPAGALPDPSKSEVGPYPVGGEPFRHDEVGAVSLGLIAIIVVVVLAVLFVVGVVGR